MTQTDLAAAIGYSVSFICSLEKGDRLPDMDVVAARFVPALALQDDVALAARLVEAAASARGQPQSVSVTVTRSFTATVEELDAPAHACSLPRQRRSWGAAVTSISSAGGWPATRAACSR